MLESANDKTLSEPFVRELLASQGSIYAYIASLLGSPADAEEVLQETNVVLCRQADEYPEIKNFAAWACRIAYFEVLSFRKRRQRDRHMFDDRLLELLAQEATCEAERYAFWQRALSKCLAELSELQRRLIVKRYSPNGSVQAIAEEYSRSPGAISQSLYRIRCALFKCARRKLSATEWEANG